MSYQRRLLPSTSMLMALDAAARAGSFTAAARELNLTQGAISRQVSALEEQLGVVLFERAGKTVLLTEVGKIYAGEIGVALQSAAQRHTEFSDITHFWHALVDATLPFIFKREPEHNGQLCNQAQCF